MFEIERTELGCAGAGALSIGIEMLLAIEAKPPRLPSGM